MHVSFWMAPKRRCHYTQMVYKAQERTACLLSMQPSSLHFGLFSCRLLLFLALFFSFLHNVEMDTFKDDVIALDDESDTSGRHRWGCRNNVNSNICCMFYIMCLRSTLALTRRLHVLDIIHLIKASQCMKWC